MRGRLAARWDAKTAPAAAAGLPARGAMTTPPAAPATGSRAVQMLQAIGALGGSAAAVAGGGRLLLLREADLGHGPRGALLPAREARLAARGTAPSGAGRMQQASRGHAISGHAAELLA